MKPKTIFHSCFVVLCLLCSPQFTAFAQNSSFTYQGRLNSGASAANGSYDLGFVVCSAATGPNFVSAIVTNTAVPVSNGLFTVTLDFGAGVFNGNDRWLQIFVRTNGTPTFTTLSPRQQLNSAPYSITAANVSGAVSASQLSGYINTSNVAAGSISSTMLAAGSVTSNQLAAGSVTTTSIADGAVTTAKLTNGTSAFRFATLQDPETYGYDYFGTAIAAIGTDKVAVGASYQDHGVHLYDTNGTLLRTYGNPAQIALSSFGYSVAGVGTTKVLIGAPQDDTSATDSGAAYLFDANSTNLIVTFANPAPAVNDQFGISVAALGTSRVIIGAPFDNAGANDAGVAHLYSTNGSLLATFLNPTPKTNEYFGWAVATVSTDRVLIGAHRADVGANESVGAAYLFTTNGSLVATFNNPALGSYDDFGSSLAAIGSDKVLIGAPGDDAAYLFSTNGTLITTFNNPDGGFELFGISVAAVGTDKILIGASDADDGSSSSSGMAYLFRTNGTLIETIRNPAPTYNALFGTSVAAMSSTKIAISTAKVTGGQVYLFNLDAYVPGLIGEGVTDGSITAGSFDSSVGVWQRLGAHIYYDSLYVGIGTNTPRGQLHIHGRAFNDPKIILTPNAANGTSEIQFYENPNMEPGWILRDDGSAAHNPFHFVGVTNGVETGPLVTILRRNMPGAMGLAAPPAANQLEVEGTASKTTAGSWLANSDARIKRDIEPVTGALQKIEKVRPVSFHYTDDYRAQHRSVDDRRYLNVVAQEFREVFPDDVKSSGEKLPDGSEVLQVDTYPLTIYSVAAIQELNHKVTADLKQKETEITELKQSISELKELLKAMNRKLDNAGR